MPIFFVVLLAGKILSENDHQFGFHIVPLSPRVPGAGVWILAWGVRGGLRAFCLIYSQRLFSFIDSFLYDFVWRLKGIPTKVWRCSSLDCACVWGRGVGERMLLLQD